MLTRQLGYMLGLGLTVTLPCAFATTYTTSGCFSNPMAATGGTSASAVCTSTGSTFSFNDLGGGTETLTYTDATTNLAPGGTINLGSFNFVSTGSGSGAFYGGTFTLGFTLPNATTGEFTAVLAGNQNGSFGGYTITFSSLSENFNSPNGNFSVTLLSNPLQAGSSNPTSTLAAALSDPTPEPLPPILLGSGLALIGLVRWKSTTRTSRPNC